MYLGPYAELPVKLKSIKRDNCPTPANCPNPTTEPFCPQCGIQVSRRFHEFQQADPPIPNFLFENLKEALFTTDGMAGPERLGDAQVVYRFLGNVRRPNQPREFHLDESTDLHIDLTLLNAKEEIAWFKQAFSPEWMLIQKTYGAPIFRWGLLQWFS